MHAAGGAGWTRLAGVAGLVFVAATLFALGAAGSTPTAGDPAEVIRAFYKDHFAIEAVSAFALPVCAMLFAFFAGTLGSLVGDDRRSQWRMVFIAGTAAVAIGWIVLGFARMLLVDAVDQALGDAVLQVLVLLDAHRRVTALLLDAPAEFALFVGHAARAGLPGLDAPFCQTLLLVITDAVADDAPTADQRAAYRAIRRAHMAQGLQLLDVVLTDGDRVRSVSCACDTEPVWLDTFVPADGTEDPAA